MLEKETKQMLLIYVLPIIVLAAILGAIHPVAAQVVLFMLIGVGAIAVGMAFFIDYLDRKS